MKIPTIVKDNQAMLLQGSALGLRYKLCSELLADLTPEEQKRISKNPGSGELLSMMISVELSISHERQPEG